MKTEGANKLPRSAAYKRQGK